MFDITKFKKSLIASYLTLILTVCGGWYVINFVKTNDVTTEISFSVAPTAQSSQVMQGEEDWVKPNVEKEKVVIIEEESWLDSIDFSHPLVSGLLIPVLLYFGKQLIDLLFKLIESRLKLKEA